MIYSLKKSKNRAFSLIELSIVILIIGILVAGITQSSRLIEQFRINSSRSMTRNSPVSSIKDLVAWWETTLEESFDSSIDSNDSTNNRVANWYDIAVTDTFKNNAAQTNSTNRPVYVTKALNNLPVVRFTAASSHFLNLPDGTIPSGNSQYTVFIVSTPSGMGTFAMLGGGTYATSQANAFRYGVGGLIVNYWFNNDITAPAGSAVSGVTNILTFSYNHSTRIIYKNGAQLISAASGPNQVSTAANMIGNANTTNEYMNGDIAEIIIFSRALKTEEKEAIEEYLSKKYDITLS